MIGSVVIVDDELASRRLLELACKPYSKIIKGFSNPYDALAQMVDGPPDLVISDYKMPEVNGVEFMGMINDIIWPKLPVVMISAYTNANCVNDAIVAGAIDYLHKPLRLRDIKEMFHKILQ